MVIRKVFRRKRKYRFGPSRVRTDGVGNITDIPLHQMDCLGNPVEYYWGIFDTPWVRIDAYGNRIEKPKDCAMCTVSAACGKVANERVTTNTELDKLFNEWERQTQRLTGNDVYEHPSWAHFVTACTPHRWGDSNELALKHKRAREAADRKAKRTRERNARRRKPRAVPKHERERILKDRDSLATELRAIRLGPKAPPWIAKRSSENCDLMADVWQASELIEMSGIEVTAKAIIEWLTKENRLPVDLPAGFATRVNEIRRCLERLIEEGLWTRFAPPVVGVNVGAGAGLPEGMIWIDLEPRARSIGN